MSLAVKTSPFSLDRSTTPVRLEHYKAAPWEWECSLPGGQTFSNCLRVRAEVHTMAGALLAAAEEEDPGDVEAVTLSWTAAQWAQTAALGSYSTYRFSIAAVFADGTPDYFKSGTVRLFPNNYSAGELEPPDPLADFARQDDLDALDDRVEALEEAPGGGGGGVTVHADLTGRDAADSHPQSAITGLTSALAAKAAQTQVDLLSGSVDNLSDALDTKAAHTDMVSGLALKADLASPALTGNPTAPTQTAGNDSTRLATTAFVQAAIAAILNAPPSTLDTLAEIASALGNDPNFATTITAALAGKLAKASNLSDLTDAAAALTNLGGSTLGKSLFTIASASAALDALGLSANGKSLVAAANYAGMKALLAIGQSDVDGLDSALAVLTSVAAAAQSQADTNAAQLVASLDCAGPAIIGASAAGLAGPLGIGSGLSISGGQLVATSALELDPFLSGYTYALGARNATSMGTATMAANTLRARPFYVWKACTLDLLSLRVTTAAASKLIRAGIYTDSSGYPGALVSGSDPGTYDAGSTGVKSQSTTVVLSVGRHWIATNSDGAPGVRGITADGCAPLIGWDTALAGNPYIGLSVASTFGAMPSTFPGSAAPYTATAASAILGRAA